MKTRTDELRRELLHACRMIVGLGLDSGPFGNLSVRLSPDGSFLQVPEGVAFDKLKPEDLLTVEGDGETVNGKHAPHPRTFVHASIYRLRPDVGAVVHTHSRNTVALSLLKTKIEPFTQLGASLHGDQGLFLGFSGRLRDLSEGAAIAESLGQNSIVIAKNHGVFAVGPDLCTAVWNFVVADWAAQVHLDAHRVGLLKADPLEPELVKKSKEELRDGLAKSMWVRYA